MFSLQAGHNFLHQLTGVGRIYYYITRWLFGNDYIPFAMSVKEEIHPLSVFVLNNYERIRLIFVMIPFIIPTISLVLIIHLIHRFFFYETNYYYFYLKMKRCIRK